MENFFAFSRIFPRHPFSEIIIFDPDGDLELQVKCKDDFHGHVSWRVCSKALARASPIFKRMLYGSFAESKPAAGKWVVTLNERDYHSLDIVMNIIHGNYHRVPKDLFDCRCLCGGLFEYDHLYYIARVVDKYDMVHILRPWADVWIRGSTDSIESIHKTAVKKRERGDGQLTWIAWVLGDEVLLNHMLDVIFLHTCIAWRRYKDPEARKPGDRGQEEDSEEDSKEDSEEFELFVNLEDGYPLYNPEGEETQVLSILGVAEQIEKRRLCAIMPVLVLLKPLVAEVLENMDAGHMGPGAPRINRAVLMHDFGEVSDGNDFLDIPLSKCYKGSVAHLHRLVTELEEIVLREPRYYRCGHRQVLEDIKELLRETRERHAVQLSEPQKEHLRRQRLKSGIKLRPDRKMPARI
ncbi:hypothetical protein CONLIGDRAFT_669810 [Coniochaeta ligniaria NRRL 30616]|uniref:BTB domain-containing protein n=1 Tax=Coniochaeta ligniaria NRRL 30616 TaxID=1408157 RepID=A0A1J7IRG3_9PEZI|nr:hypothetical protein CONLIGDRAFT_669810 [Coniochaeta ligniaria NRRL 30616]